MKNTKTTREPRESGMWKRSGNRFSEQDSMVLPMVYQPSKGADESSSTKEGTQWKRNARTVWACSFDMEPHGEQRAHVPSKWSASIRLPNSDTTPNRQTVISPGAAGSSNGPLSPPFKTTRAPFLSSAAKCVDGASSSDNCRPRCVVGSPFADGFFLRMWLRKS